MVGLVLTPLMAAVWMYEPGVVWSGSTLVERTLGPTLESLGALTFGSSGSWGDGLAYQVYGKGFFLVYLLMIPIIRIVRPDHIGSKRFLRQTRWIWTVLLVSVCASLAGDFVSYWGKSLPGIAGEWLWGWGFMIEMIGIMGLLLATLAYGTLALFTRLLSRWESTLLILAVVAVVPFSKFVVDYWPNALVVPSSIAWAAIGICRWTAERGLRPPARREGDGPALLAEATTAPP
jgi:hypothetical protein